MNRLPVMLTCAALALSASCAAQQPPDAAQDMQEARRAMVEQIRRYGVADRKVLEAMSKVRRHMYIPERYRHPARAYGDHPSPIGYGQTISQPFIVAYMTQLLDFKPGDRILEIGSGSGYQAAVLAEMGAEVYTIEILKELADHAAEALEAEGYGDVKVLHGDGYKGWPEHAPFDRIIVTAAPGEIPQALVEQLAEGGRMVLPVGVDFQRIVILEKRDGGILGRDDLPVRFVPMVHGTPGEDGD